MTTPGRTDSTARWSTVDSPVGPLLLGAEENAITHLWFPPVTAAQEMRTPPGRGVQPADDELLDQATKELAEYFRAERRVFDLPLNPRGSEFERGIWRLLERIPYGSTVSYGQIAKEMGDAGAAQAVGRAVGANPIGILVPCHRVVGSDGSMTGFAGGLACKSYLLDLEGFATGKTLLPPYFSG